MNVAPFSIPLRPSVAHAYTKLSQSLFIKIWSSSISSSILFYDYYSSLILESHLWLTLKFNCVLCCACVRVMCARVNVFCFVC